MKVAEQDFLSISEIVGQFNAMLQRSFPEVRFKGEISQCTRASSGHLYMTIKDENSQMAVVMWRGSAEKLNFNPEQGVEVHCYGKPNIYKGNGKFQVVVHRMEQAGAGLLQQRFLELKAKLEKEGLFDEARKRPIPSFPLVVGIITSESGAAVHDVMTKITERMPSTKVYLYNARVQGNGAAEEIAAGIEYFNSKQLIEVLIIGRGGGSLEDLWPFNEEVVARAVFASRIPIISAVGHEVDVSLSDLTADLRAPTPTAAGEIVVPKRSDLLEKLELLSERLADTDSWMLPLGQAVDEFEFRLSGSFDRLLSQATAKLESLRADIATLRPDKLFSQLRGKVALLGERLSNCTRERFVSRQQQALRMTERVKGIAPSKLIGMQHERLGVLQQRLIRSSAENLRRRSDKLVRVSQLLGALNPTGVLSRGFALVRQGETLVTSAEQLQVGSQIGVQFSSSSAQATVEEIGILSKSQAKIQNKKSAPKIERKAVSLENEDAKQLDKQEEKQVDMFGEEKKGAQAGR